MNSVGEELLAAQLEQAKAPPFVREHRFHPVRRWRIDFAWPAHRLAVEVEGGVWSGGRHVNPQGYLDDIAKYNALTLAGYRLLRVPTEWVTQSDRALKLILQALAEE